MARAILPVVVGTAGHIDHGKSSLVKALTGIDPDRLKEEKERGLTIDLGFARLRLADGRWLGLVDVPGHERFVRNMVAGCTGIDLAILVVAADDGVMPQTREHLDIVDLLGVRGGLIALSKVDMVDEGLVAMAEDEIRQVVQGTVLAEAAICRVSSVTGVGLPELRAQLEALALQVEPRHPTGPFRMPIQRVFSLPGIGTVVTGIPQSGSIDPGAEVEVLPLRQRVKVRGLHAYGGKIEHGVAGHSTALSLPDAKDLGLHRGMVVAAPGAFEAGDAVDIELRTTRRAPTLRHRQPIRFHTGTIEVRGELLLLDRETVTAGDTVLARVELDEELCCAAADRFLLRLQTPAITVGGGRVLRLGSTGRYRRQKLGAELRALVAAGDRPEARIRHELQQAGAEGRAVDDLARALAADEELVLATIDAMADVHLHRRAMRAFLRAALDAGVREVEVSVGRLLAKRPASASVQRSALRTGKSLPQALLDAVIDHLVQRGLVRAAGRGRLLFVERLRPLPTAEQQLLDRIVATCEQRPFRPPDRTELQSTTGVGGEALDSLLERAHDEGRLEPVGDHCYAPAAVRAALRAIVGNCQRHGGVLDIPALRDELDTSRKYLIPLLEHVDAIGLTVLRGGVRRLLPQAAQVRELLAGPDDPVATGPID